MIIKIDEYSDVPIYMQIRSHRILSTKDERREHIEEVFGRVHMLLSRSSICQSN